MSKPYDKAKDLFNTLPLDQKQKFFDDIGVVLANEIDEENETLKAKVADNEKFKESIKKQ